MSTTRLGPSLVRQSTATALAGLTTLTLLWGMVRLADGYRADSGLQTVSCKAAHSAASTRSVNRAGPLTCGGPASGSGRPWQS